MSVAHTSTTYLTCNSCKKAETFRGTHSKKTVRTWSRPQGWHTRPDDRDLCGDCWAEGKR